MARTTPSRGHLPAEVAMRRATTTTRTAASFFSSALLLCLCSLCGLNFGESGPVVGLVQVAAAQPATSSEGTDGVWSGLETRLPLYRGVAAFPCTVLTRKDGWVGCRAMGVPGSVGRLWPVLDAAAADVFLRGSGDGDTAGEPPAGALIAVLSSETFTRENVDVLLGPDSHGASGSNACSRCSDVAGAIVLADKSGKPASFSIAAVYPQREYSLYPDSARAWNPSGTDWVTANYTKPIWLMMDNATSRADAGRSIKNDPLIDWAAFDTPTNGMDSDQVLRLAEENVERKAVPPQWGAKLKTFMQAAKNTEICKRRSQCQGLGSWNVWATPGTRRPAEAITTASKKLVYLMAGMDSNAFFHDVVPGARSAISGTVAAAAAMIAVHDTGRADDLPAVPVLGLFAAESWGYIGSRAFVRDVEDGSCDSMADSGFDCDTPFIRNYAQMKHLTVDPQRVIAAIDVNQVGRVTDSTFYAHYDSRVDVSAILSALQAASAPRNQTVVEASAVGGEREIPPSSLMSFLRRPGHPENIRGVPSVVFAEHDTSYTNAYYHSRFDDAGNLDPKTVCDASQVVASAVWALAGGVANASEPTVDCALVSQMLDTLVTSYTSTLGLEMLLQPDQKDDPAVLETLPPIPSQYSSVWNKKRLNSVSVAFIHNLLFYRLRMKSGDKCSANSDCDDEEKCIRGRCLASNVYFHDAQSLFWTEGDEEASQWTESDWSQMYVDAFLMDSTASEVFLLIGGILTFFASIAGTWYLRKHLSSKLA